MSVQPIPRPSLLRRIINLTALLYLLSMLLYFLCRYVIQDRIWFISLLNTFAIFLFSPLPILLLLVLIVRSRRAAFYLLPVMMWAVLWFGPRFLPKNIGSSTATASTFRVMTNNVSHFNRSPDLVPQLALAQNPDVIFLQEVLLTPEQQTLAPLNSAYPYQTRQFDLMRTSMYAADNVTYSRFPFVISEQVDPHIPEMPQIYRNVIEVNDRRIALYNIHLLSPGGGQHFGGRFTNFNNYFVRYTFSFNDIIRNSQIDALLAYLATEPYPYVVAGDFNTSDFSMTYSHIAAQMEDSFAEAGIGLGSSWPAARALRLSAIIPPLIRIDYIWHSAGLHATNAWAGDYVGSDHFPMFADLALNSS